MDRALPREQRPAAGAALGCRQCPRLQTRPSVAGAQRPSTLQTHAGIRSRTLSGVYTRRVGPLAGLRFGRPFPARTGPVPSPIRCYPRHTEWSPRTRIRDPAWQHRTRNGDTDVQQTSPASGGRRGSGKPPPSESPPGSSGAPGGGGALPGDQPSGELAPPQLRGRADAAEWPGPQSVQTSRSARGPPRRGIRTRGCGLTPGPWPAAPR
jgi:hypothetical protein